MSGTGKPWSGVPLLNVPILITDGTVLTTPTNTSASASLLLPNVVLFAEATPNNPMDTVPAPGNHSIALFHANQPLSQFDDNGITNQFNPFVKENIPPVITRVEIDTWDDWGWSWGIPVVEASWSKIDMWVMDVADFTLHLGVKDRNRYVDFSGQGGGIERHFTTTIEIDYRADSLAEYYVNATVTDSAGNVAYYEKEVAGFFGGIMNFLEDVWSAMAGAFGAAWEAVKAAVDWIVDFILNSISALFKQFIDVISTLFESLINNMASTAKQYLNPEPDNFALAASIIVGALLDTMIMEITTSLMIGLMAFDVITSVVLPVSQAILDLIAPILLSMLVGAIIGATLAMIVDEINDNGFVAKLNSESSRRTQPAL